MPESLPSNRITVYQIPANTVRWILAWEEGRPIMADATLRPGPYVRNPNRPEMCLVPIDHETAFCSYQVVESDVARFATNYVPETDHLSCPSSEPVACTGSAAGGFQDTEREVPA